MTRKFILITDIDNTLFDWFDMWHTSFSYLLNRVKDSSGSDLETLLNEIKKIHQNHGTSEYHFLLDELSPVLGLPPHVTEDIRQGYYRIRNEKLVLYDGVREALTELKGNGVRIIAFSESKKYYSSYRLAQLGLGNVVDRLYCPADHSLEKHKEPFEAFEEEKIITLSKDFKKPNPQILNEIIEDERASTLDCVYIGDSKSKDIQMAQAANVDFAWFAHGAAHLVNRQLDYNLLKRVTHWTEASVKEEQNQLAVSTTSIEIPVDKIINNYYEVTKFF